MNNLYVRFVSKIDFRENVDKERERGRLLVMYKLKKKDEMKTHTEEMFSAKVLTE